MLKTEACSVSSKRETKLSSYYIHMFKTPFCVNLMELCYFGDLTTHLLLIKREGKWRHCHGKQLCHFHFCFPLIRDQLFK